MCEQHPHRNNNPPPNTYTPAQQQQRHTHTLHTIHCHTKTLLHCITPAIQLTPRPLYTQHSGKISNTLLCTRQRVLKTSLQKSANLSLPCVRDRMCMALATATAVRHCNVSSGDKLSRYSIIFAPSVSKSNSLFVNTHTHMQASKSQRRELRIQIVMNEQDTKPSLFLQIQRLYGPLFLSLVVRFS